MELNCNNNNNTGVLYSARIDRQLGTQATYYCFCKERFLKYRAHLCSALCLRGAFVAIDLNFFGFVTNLQLLHHLSAYKSHQPLSITSALLAVSISYEMKTLLGTAL